MKKQARRMILIFAAMVCAIWGGHSVRAAVVDIQVTSGGTTEVTVNLGDTGHIQPITSNLIDAFAQPVAVARWEYESYGDDDIVRVDEWGNYTALSCGTVTYTVNGYSQGEDSLVFTGYCRITVMVDMTNVTLANNQLKGYITGYDGFSGKIAINSEIVLTEENSSVQYTTDDEDMDVRCQLDNNTLLISTYTEGSTTVTVTINGKSFVIHVKVAKVEITKTGLVAARGKKITLKIKGTSDKAEWSSSDSGIASVSGNGTVKCKKAGNAVITAKFGEIKLGCAVSVVSSGLLKTVNTAKKIGANWKYSQPRRMQKGYYDCSSLVWKSYKKMNKNFGGRSYAPVAADIAKWCANHKQWLTKSYTWKQVQNMKLRPGDLLFKTGEKNGRYMGIYHVEMFVGYSVSYYDESGKPVLSEMWAARPVGYGGGGFPIARPTK